jgi:polar amino acid transport system substrate-binding protein
MKKVVFIFAVTSVLALTFVTIASAGAVLDRILQKGELVVGITGDQPPLNAKTKTGKIIGLDADLARLIAGNLGVKVKFATMPFAKLLPALEAGEVDMILSGMTMTMERNLKVAFIGPYFVSGKGILTKKENIATLEQADGLNKPGLKVAALTDSTSQELVEIAAPKATLVKTKSYDEATDLLIQDKIDALIADYPFCAVSAFRYQEKGLIAGKTPITFEPLGIALQEDTLLINWVQNFLKMLEGTGVLRELTARWFKTASWISELE